MKRLNVCKGELCMTKIYNVILIMDLILYCISDRENVGMHDIIFKGDTDISFPINRKTDD